jgi:hypothetical protein
MWFRDDYPENKICDVRNQISPEPTSCKPHGVMLNKPQLESSNEAKNRYADEDDGINAEQDRARRIMALNEARHGVRQNVVKGGCGVHEREDKAQEEEPSGYRWWDGRVTMDSLGFRCIRGHCFVWNADDCSLFFMSTIETRRSRNFAPFLLWQGRHN